MLFRPFRVFLAYVFLSGKLTNPPPRPLVKSSTIFFLKPSLRHFVLSCVRKIAKYFLLWDWFSKGGDTSPTKTKRNSSSEKKSVMERLPGHHINILMDKLRDSTWGSSIEALLPCCGKREFRLWLRAFKKVWNQRVEWNNNLLIETWVHQESSPKTLLTWFKYGTN